MKRYDTLNLKSDSRMAIVATSYVSPLSEISFIGHELKSIGYKGEVIFDLVLSNGFSSNRFLKANFDGENIDVNKIEVLPALKCDVLDELHTFFYEHPQYVNASSLPEPQKYILLNKVLVGEVIGDNFC